MSNKPIAINHPTLGVINVVSSATIDETIYLGMLLMRESTMLPIVASMQQEELKVKGLLGDWESARWGVWSDDKSAIEKLNRMMAEVTQVV